MAMNRACMKIHDEASFTARYHVKRGIASELPRVLSFSNASSRDFDNDSSTA